MGNKTVKRLVILIGVIALVGGGGYALWAFQVNRMAHGVLARAAQAEKEGKYDEAERLYGEHLAVVPDDVEVQLKYAEAILKQENASKRQQEALAIFESVLGRYAGRVDVRRRAAELAVEVGLFEKGREHLAILLPKPPKDGADQTPAKGDGHLEYLMGRCYEQDNDAAGAAARYGLAIEHGAPERLEAAQRRAMLLGGKLGKKDEADKVIEAMVKSAPDDYRAYLARGRYRRRFADEGSGGVDLRLMSAVNGVNRIPTEGKNLVVVAIVDQVLHFRIFDGDGKMVVDTDEKRLTERVRPIEAFRNQLASLWPPHELTGSEKGRVITAVTSIVGHTPSGDDFRKALELAPGRPEVYLEVADAVARESGPDEARKVLDQGLAAAPKSIGMYLALANLEERAGRHDGAIDALELGLKAMPDDLNLRGQLAILLAGRGEAEAGRLNLQIIELERLHANPSFTQYLTAYKHFNKHEFIRAKQILTPLQPDVARNPALKSMVNVLLAKCYREMGETEQQQEAMQRAYSTDPNDLTARLAMIDALIKRGDLDGAIREYRALNKLQPGSFGLQLAELLVLQNRQLPEEKRKWGEVEALVADALKALPEKIEPELVRAELLRGQGQEAKADDALETIRARFPKDQRPWTARADLLIGQKKFAEAQTLLTQARQQLGDRVELRLARARLAVKRGGAQVVPALNELTQGLHAETFSREDRRRLLTVVAEELGRHQDLKGASAAWTELAGEERQSLTPRLQLFDLALKAGDRKGAKDQIDEIAKLDEQYGQFCQSQFLAWQARDAGADAATKEKARAEARALLNELKVRRPDLPRIPLALAMLDEEELAEAGTEEVRKEKLESAITSCRRAIELGHRDAGVARHYIQLLFRAGRGNEALEFYSQMPAIGQISGDLGRVAAEVALANRDYNQAEDIARKAVDANPEDFLARVELVRVLMEQRKNDDAEAVLRKGIEIAEADPNRWLILVRFLVMTRQAAKAEAAVRDAEARLAAAPTALAQCCAMLGKGFELGEPDKAKSWYGKARDWFNKAQAALKDPNDLTVKRQLAEFLLQTNEAATAEGPLKEIVARTADGKSPALATWARRSLAQVYVTTTPPRTAEAQALFAGQPGHDDDADDLRVLSMIHETQGAPDGRNKAIADLQALIGREAATADDRRRLALLLEAAGDWPRALEQFRELVLRADAARDPETIARRPLYLTLVVEALLRHHKAGDNTDLAEARRLVDKLKPIQRDALIPLMLEAQIDKAANQLDVATNRFREFAARADLNTAARLRLADAAEKIGLYDAAESIYRLTADEPPPDRLSPPNRARLALFLARRGKLKDAIDICEGLWAKPEVREVTATVCVQILCDTSFPFDDPQTRRVVGWIEDASAENPRSMPYLVGLGNLFERMGDYPKAEEMYRRAIKINDRDGIASNNLAWLLALNGGKANDALELISNAIRARGPLPEYLDTRGMIYLRMGDVPHAVGDLEAACKAAPSPPKFFHLAQAYLARNDPEKARKALLDGKTRGLPGGLHRLEVAQYDKLASALGAK